MDRRTFMKGTSIVGAASLGALSAAGTAKAANGRDYYELRQYHIESEAQEKAFGEFMTSAMIPALNRIDVKPVGIFQSEKEMSPIYMLLRHKSLESFGSVTQKLLADEEFLSKGADFLNAPSSNPAYKRMESSVMIAFTGMPNMEIPVKSPGRVFQLRTYESPSVKTGQKKIEMFNTAEIKIFRKVGLNPVFFGETLAGAKMPNLTYMLGFESAEEQKASWKRFGGDPDWQKLRAIPEYGDKRILCGITNIVLKPTEYSQI